jgi:hypothetical protein
MLIWLLPTVTKVELNLENGYTNKTSTEMKQKQFLQILRHHRGAKLHDETEKMLKIVM